MGSALKDKRFRCVVRDPADAPQPDGWTQVQVEAERRVRDREKAKITLPSPEHLKRIMLDAPSLDGCHGGKGGRQAPSPCRQAPCSRNSAKLTAADQSPF